jgi:DNA polymerase-1
VGNKELRIRTKAYVYGLSYGREEFSIAAEFGISVKEAKRGMNAWMSLIPELRAWQAGIKHSVLHEQDDLITTFGRHRRFWLITKENQKDVVKEALSYYPQSTASDICLRALCRIRRKLGDRGAVRIPVHDSILVECPISEADEVAALMKEEMEQSGREWTDFVPFKVDIERGFSWGSLTVG